MSQPGQLGCPHLAWPGAQRDLCVAGPHTAHHHYLPGSVQQRVEVVTDKAYLAGGYLLFPIGTAVYRVQL